MERSGHIGELQLRRQPGGQVALRGRFPYNKRATLSDGGRTGRPRKEVFAPKAFAYRVERPDEEIHLLLGHDFNRPLASRGAGTLRLSDTADALTFDADIGPELAQASWVQDFLGAYRAGLMVGISPGFRIPPQRAVKNAEKVEEEDPKEGNALIRTIFEALLFEISIVTVPAYKETLVEAEERSWELTPGGVAKPKHFQRWR